MNAKSVIFDDASHVGAFNSQIKERSDKLINYFLSAYLIGGILLSFFYDTWEVGIGIGVFSVASYYVSKWLFPTSDFYQYVLSAVLGIFMAQYIFQMHGMFEMHFTAFIASAMLITYQNWKLQIPLVLVVVVHHAAFGYLQYAGMKEIRFTQLEYMDLQTFIIHVLLAAIIFFICGLWAYHFKKYSKRHIEQTYEITKLQEAEGQKNELMKTNMELDNFVYSVSHDLRAPLSSMNGVIEISEEETNDPVIREHLSILKQSVTKLDSFIQEILDYSRNSRLEVRKQEIDFREILPEVVNNLKHMQGGNRDLKIDYKILNERRFISDKSRITVVLNNLISNAIRYQNPNVDNPFVQVVIDMSDTETDIIVKDNGIGISQEQQEKIFDMFYRVSEMSVGSGLGLYLVKEIANKLEGKIEVESAPGIGSTFCVKIPDYSHS